MGTDHDHLHYTPSSVGALMDPGFLRQAVHDADSPHGLHTKPVLSEPTPRWRAALHSAMGACLQRLHL